MEIFAMDIFVLIISLIFATTIFSFYAFSTSLFCYGRDCDEAIAVHDIIRILKKVCPIDSGNKWRLLPLNAGLSRCWSKKAQFPGFHNNITLCGTACAVTCSSMYAFSLIADVAKWGEWEPMPSSQCLLLKPFCDNKLQKDVFMQADQVVGIQRGTNVQSYVAMYRFTSFSEKTVKWILFWNATKLEFMFFLIQPAVSKTVASQCVITHIFGTMQSSSRAAPYVAQRMRNIFDFLHLSQLHIIASKYISAIPAVSAQYHPNVINNAETNYLPEGVMTESNNNKIHYMFVLVPILHNLKYFCKRLKGFQLVMKKVDGELPVKKQKKKDLHIKSAKEKLKRSASDACIRPKTHADFASNLELNMISSRGDSSIIARASSDPKQSTSVIVEENFRIDLDCKEEQVACEKMHRHSEPSCLKAEKSKTSSQSDCSETHTDEDIYVNLHIIHENASQENVGICNKNDVFCSSTSDFELLESSQQFLDCRLADFLTQGNYGASELQAEMMLASQFDESLSSEEQVSGSWKLDSSYKSIKLLTKTTAGQFMKILSFLCQTNMSVPVKDVWKCVKNPRFRFISDETVKTVKIVERISDSQKLIHIYHETSGFLKKEGIDFCLLQTEREEENLYYSSFHSLEYEKCPLMTSVVRGILRPSGWVVERLGDKECKVTHLMQIIVSSPDSLYIQQLKMLVPLAMYNLKHFVESRPK